MKKIIYIFIVIILLTACNLNNTPTSKVEELLSKYQSLNKQLEINTNEFSNIITIENINNEDIDELIEKQNKNMTYEIKNEEIDGDNATVTTEIEVYNYKDVINNNNNKDIIKELNKTKERITYTIDFTLTKNEKEKWKLDELTEEQKYKLLGII